MADNQHQFITKGVSLSRQSDFTREDYLYWKDGMEMYIKSTMYRIWLIITNGDIPINRPDTEQADDDLAIMELNTKAIYTLTYAQSKNMYNQIYKMRTVKEIQDSLSINYEGTKDVIEESRDFDQTLWKLHHEGWRICGRHVWKASNSSKQSRGSWIDIL